MDKYIPCRWMTSFVYLRNLATSDIPISGFPGCNCPSQISGRVRMTVEILSRSISIKNYLARCLGLKAFITISKKVIWPSGLYENALDSPFHPYKPIQIPWLSVQIHMRWLITSCLIRIYTICHSATDL